MSALAEYLRVSGFVVSGSDIEENVRVAALRNKGIRVEIGHRAENLRDAQVVIYSSAIGKNNPEKLFAEAKGIPLVSRAELLAIVAEGYEHTVAFAGSHGKTTATALCAHVFANCSSEVTAHIGGEDLQFGNIHIAGKRFFITEACEYMGNFLKLTPEAGVVLNTDADHLDYYGTPKKLEEVYCEFCEKCKCKILCRDDKISSLCHADVTFGLSAKSDVCAENIFEQGGKYSFTLRTCGELMDRIKLNVYGKHNIYNALAAAAVGLRYGFPPYLIADGIGKFQGVRRRFEELGCYKGAVFIADYAHHPKEISAALQTAHEFCKGRTIVIFQPHTYSRTKLLFNDFVNVLASVEHLVIYKTYAAREYFDEEGCALTLSERLPKALYIETVKEFALYIERTVRGGDTVLILGAGDIYTIARRTLRQLTGKNI